MLHISLQRSAQHDRGIGFGLGLFARSTPACRVWSTTHSVKFKNDLAAAFALGGMCNCGFEFAQWISFFDFRFEQTTSGHIEKRSKRLHALRRSGVVVPFVDPDAAKSQVFENEKAGGNFQRLQAHCAKADERAARRETISETQRAIA